MPTEADGFLARIRELPDDDGPRLIYADWLDEQGDPRGEFIRVQIGLTRLPDNDPRRDELARIEHDLIARHTNAWAARFRGLATGPVFRRGFVEEVKVTARQFLAHGDALFAADPVRHLHLLDLSSHLRPVLSSPHLARLSGLSAFAQHLGPQLAFAVAESPHLTGLRVLRLGRNRVGDEGAARLAESAHLAGLEELDLSENELGEIGGKALAQPRFTRLRRLELGGNAIGPVAAVAIAASEHLPALERLGLDSNRLGSARLASTTRPEALLQVANLDLSSNDLSAAVLAPLFGAIETPRVRHLDLSDNTLGDAVVHLLAASPVAPGLLSLRLAHTEITDLGLEELATSASFPRLSALDVSNNPLHDSGYLALADSQHLRALKRLTYSAVSATPWVQITLQRRFDQGASGVW